MDFDEEKENILKVKVIENNSTSLEEETPSLCVLVG